MIDDNSGADFLPAKLFVTLTVAVLLLVIMASGMSDLSGAYSAGRARAEAERIAEFARMAYYADNPVSTTERFIVVSVPASVHMIVYGAVPGNGTPVRADRSYFIEYEGGRSETYVADMPFACDMPDGPADIPVIIYPGDSYIKARPVSVNGAIKAGISVEAA